MTNKDIGGNVCYAKGCEGVIMKFFTITMGGRNVEVGVCYFHDNEHDAIEIARVLMRDAKSAKEDTYHEEK